MGSRRFAPWFIFALTLLSSHPGRRRVVLPSLRDLLVLGGDAVTFVTAYYLSSPSGTYEPLCGAWATWLGGCVYNRRSAFCFKANAEIVGPGWSHVFSGYSLISISI